MAWEAFLPYTPNGKKTEQNGHDLLSAATGPCHFLLKALSSHLCSSLVGVNHQGFLLLKEE
jgi:hypothetical protein